MRDVRVAVSCDDPSLVASLLAQSLGMEFQSRDSAFWGDYWTELPKGAIRVLANEDPMYLPGQDPPEDRYFEAGFSTYRTLVDIEEDEMLGEQVVKLLSANYHGSQVVFANAY